MAITAQVGAWFWPDREWNISYDDVTRNISAVANGDTGFTYIVISITSSISRSISVFPISGGVSVKPELAANMAAADFAVAPDGAPVVLASGINANQVSRIVGKTGLGGLSATSTHSDI